MYEKKIEVSWKLSNTWPMHRCVQIFWTWMLRLDVNLDWDGTNMYRSGLFGLKQLCDMKQLLLYSVCGYQFLIIDHTNWQILLMKVKTNAMISFADTNFWPHPTCLDDSYMAESKWFTPTKYYFPTEISLTKQDEYQQNCTEHVSSTSFCH